MKIACYFGQVKKLGGAERRLTRIFDLIAEKEVEVYLLFPEVDTKEQIVNRYRSFLKQNSKVNLIVLPKKGLALFMYVYKNKFDTIFYWDCSRYQLPYIVAGKLSGSKRVWILCNYYTAYRKDCGIRRTLLFRIYGVLSNHLDTLYPGSLEVLKTELAHMPITVTPCPGTDVKKIFPAHKEKIILFLSRITNNKGVDLFIESIQKCSKILVEKQYRVILAGSGDIEEEIKTLISQYNLNSIIEMPGYVEPEDYINKAELFCSLQKDDNYPSQSLIEAITSGCYIVATNGGDTYRLVDKSFGVLVENKASEIARSIEKYVNMSTNERELSRRSAVNFSALNFDLSTSAKHYLEIATRN